MVWIGKNLQVPESVDLLSPPMNEKSQSPCDGDWLGDPEARSLRYFQVADYFNKASTLCCDWLACANMAVAACEMIWVRASSVEVLA